MMGDRQSIISALELPSEFGKVFLIFSFILLIAPYCSGLDFGIFKVPIFSEKASKGLKIVGPFIFVLSVLLFVPLLGRNLPVPSGPFIVQESPVGLSPSVAAVKPSLPVRCATSQPPLPPSKTLVDATRVDQPPTIDGKLDETAWSQAKPLTYAVHPPANDSTTATVKLLWDDKYLYAGFDISDTQVEDSTQPWNGDSVSVIIANGGQVREYRHSLLNDRAGNIQSAYQFKKKTTFNNSSDCDEGYIIEMRIPWSTTPSTGSMIAADFLSVDHDQNPGGPYNDPNTVFSKISWDGDENVETANRKIRLMAK